MKSTINDQNLPDNLVVTKEFMLSCYTSNAGLIHNLTQLPFEALISFNDFAIQRTENQLNLTFLNQKDRESQVCMANNPEVRDDYKDIFDTQDLLYYSFAVLHTPAYLVKDLSTIEAMEIPLPNDAEKFWELSTLGMELYELKLSEYTSTGNQQKAFEKVLNKIKNQHSSKS